MLGWFAKSVVDAGRSTPTPTGAVDKIGKSRDRKREYKAQQCTAQKDSAQGPKIKLLLTMIHRYNTRPLHLHGLCGYLATSRLCYTTMVIR